MRRPRFARCCLVLAVAIAAALPARAADDCDAPPQSWQPRSAVQALAERNGWHLERLKIDDGCYELKGRDADGQRFKARIDPATLQVLSVRHGRGHRERERERAREGQRAPPASAPPG